MPPSVSIIMPVHDVADYVGDTIRSVRQQRFADWELIVVDDGSTDRTREVVAGFATDPRIRLVAQPAAGAAAARNRGLEHARGAFLAFLDGDDLWADRFLEACVGRLQRTEADLVFTGHADLRPAGRLKPQLPRFPAGPVATAACLRALIPWEIALLMGNVVIRRTERVRALRFHAGCRIAEDTEFYFRLLCACTSACYLREVLFYYRWRPQSVMQQRWDWRRYCDCIEAMDRAWSFLETHYAGPDRPELLALLDEHNSYRRYRTLYRMLKQGAHRETRALLADERWRRALPQARRRARGLHRLKLGILRSEKATLWGAVAGVERWRNRLLHATPA